MVNYSSLEYHYTGRTKKGLKFFCMQVEILGIQKERLSRFNTLIRVIFLTDQMM